MWCHGKYATTVGDVVPHQAARLFQVDGLLQDKRCDVAHHAIRIFRKLNILDDCVTWQVGIEFAKRAPSDQFVPDVLRVSIRSRFDRDRFIDHDACDPGLGGSDGNHGQQTAQQAHTGRL